MMFPARRRQPHFSTALAVIVVAGCVLPKPAMACNVPVFRYALERWPADAYLMSVFHKGPLDPALKKQLDGLAQQPLNLEVSLVDLDSAEPKDPQPTGIEIDRGKLPWVVLRYPNRAGSPQVVWSGRLEADTLALVTDSPARQEIARRLLLGESAVWVFLESGDAEKDRSARELLQREISVAEKELRIPSAEQFDYSPTDYMPPPAGSSSDQPSGSVPLKVDFSVLPLSRSDAREEVLIAMLLGSEPDLDEYAGEPMAFPVFGQARALWAIVGKGINADNVQEACGFLTAACSCQVKSMNPGTDLLTGVDWRAVVDGEIPIHEITTADLTAVAPRLDEKPAAGDDPPVQTTAFEDNRPATRNGATAMAPHIPAERQPRPTMVGRNSGVIVGVGITLGVMLALAAGATIVVLARNHQ